MIKEWYNNAWNNGMKLSRNLKDYYRFYKMLNIQKYSTILDVGCGDGKLIKIAADHNYCIGIDISEVAVQKAQRSTTKAIFYTSTIEDFNSNIKFDYITALGSLEHCPNINQALHNLYNLGHQDSKYLIVVPNSNFFYWKLKKQKGTHQQEIGETLHSLKEWSDIFTNNNFIIDNISYDLGRGKLMKLFMPLIPINYTYQFAFLLSKGN